MAVYLPPSKSRLKLVVAVLIIFSAVAADKRILRLCGVVPGAKVGCCRDAQGKRDGIISPQQIPSEARERGGGARGRELSYIVTMDR